MEVPENIPSMNGGFSSKHGWLPTSSENYWMSLKMWDSRGFNPQMICNFFNRESDDHPVDLGGYPQVPSGYFTSLWKPNQQKSMIYHDFHTSPIQNGNFVHRLSLEISSLFRGYYPIFSALGTARISRSPWASPTTRRGRPLRWPLRRDVPGGLAMVTQKNPAMLLFVW